WYWKTTPDKIKEAVRYGIVRPYSMVGQVNAALGKYRLLSLDRARKGLMSNRENDKIAMLDRYQNILNTLEPLESLVNTDADKETIQAVLKNYQNAIKACWGKVLPVPGYLEGLLDEVQEYADALAKADDLRPFVRSTGANSLMALLRTQLTQHLYALQADNQKMTYQKKYFFALTRGMLNDYIEDARLIVDEYQADPRSPLLASHHAIYGKGKDDEMMYYDFSHERLSIAEERDALLAISFIEGCDRVDFKEKKIYNAKNEQEPLTEIKATRWTLHKSTLVWLKSVGYFLLNTLKGFLVYTRPWEEEAWDNKNFHLKAVELRKHARPDEPLWRKPWVFFKQCCIAVWDLMQGVYYFGQEITIHLPPLFRADRDSSKKIGDLQELLKQATKTIDDIKVEDKTKLDQVLKDGGHANLSDEKASMLPIASPAYILSPGEQNDILTAMIRGLQGFSDFFTHEIYAKDPFAGVLFSLAYTAGALTLFLPNAASFMFGKAYVDWMTSFSGALGAGQLGGTIAGGSTQAQAFALTSDLLMHGPSSHTAKAFQGVLKDPLTIGAYFGAAYGLGFALANIPGLEDHIKGELGSVPETGFPLVGGKGAILLYEMLHTPGVEATTAMKFSTADDLVKKSMSTEDLIKKSVDPKFVEGIIQSLNGDAKRALEQYRLVSWLATHRPYLEYLDDDTHFALLRQINAVFPERAAAEAIKKYLIVEKPRSIAFQILAIPLSYIPAIFRCLLAPFLGVYALVKKYPYPGNPIRQAYGDLYQKTRKDLTRLLVFSAHLAYLIYSGFAALLKSVVYTVGMVVSRMAALIGIDFSSVFHRAVAKFHTGMQKLGERLYPSRAIKHMWSKDPIAQTMSIEKDTFAHLQKTLKSEAPAAPVPLAPSADVFSAPPTTPDASTQTAAPEVGNSTGNGK
ncbi:MAG: hypothetical protein Q8R79_01560, partial [Legionellaceae bacterium]|nr:hypothetical protein [Legionellaceae bacterium]